MQTMYFIVVIRNYIIAYLNARLPWRLRKGLGIISLELDYPKEASLVKSERESESGRLLVKTAHPNKSAKGSPTVFQWRHGRPVAQSWEEVG